MRYCRDRTQASTSPSTTTITSLQGCRWYPNSARGWNFARQVVSPRDPIEPVARTRKSTPGASWLVGGPSLRVMISVLVDITIAGAVLAGLHHCNCRGKNLRQIDIQQ